MLGGCVGRHFVWRVQRHVDAHALLLLIALIVGGCGCGGGRSVSDKTVVMVARGEGDDGTTAASIFFHRGVGGDGMTIATNENDDNVPTPAPPSPEGWMKGLPRIAGS